MARVYEYQRTDTIPGALADQPPRRTTPIDGLSKMLLMLVVVLAGLAFGGLTMRQQDWKFALAAAGIVLAVGIALVLMRLALRRERDADSLGKLAKAAPSRHVELVLEQLDDRFAVFQGVTADATSIDHLIVGPTGLFAVVETDIDTGSDSADSATLKRAREEAAAVKTLIARLLPEVQPEIEPVVCTAPNLSGRVMKSEQGVWVLPTDKLAVALIKRSNQPGAITHNVNETGAFSSNALQAAAIERALADHWSIPTRKRIGDYMYQEDGA